MTAVVVLSLVVAADLVRGGAAERSPRTARWRRSAPAALVVVAVGVVAVGVVLVVGLGAHVAAVVVGALVAAAWAVLMAPGVPVRAWPAAALGAVLVGAALVPAPAAAGALVEAWSRTVPGRAGVPAEVALAVVVVVVALTRTSNLVTRATLARARRLPDGDAADVSDAQVPSRVGGWRVAVRGRDLVAVRPVEAPSSAGPVMRGGRLIGPLERAFVLVLALAGAYPVIAAVLAAKGVVRFPEISADRARGTKAEEFLVGSLVSWACAGVGVLLVRVSGLG